MGIKLLEASAYLDLRALGELDVELEINVVRPHASVLPPGKLEGSSREAVLLVEPIRGSTVGENHHNLVNGLWILGEKVLQKGLDIDF